MNQPNQPPDPDDLGHRSVDARLRDAAVPPGLGARLDLAVLFDDSGIDRVLARVEPPAGLADRVRGAFESLDRPPLVAAMRAAWQRDGEPAAGSPGVRRTLPRWVRSGLALGVDLATTGAAVAAVVLLVATLVFAGTRASRWLAAPARVVPAVARDARGARDGTAGGEPAADVVAGRRPGHESAGGSGSGESGGPLPDAIAAAGSPVAAAGPAEDGPEAIPETTRPSGRSADLVRGFPAVVSAGESWAAGSGVRVVTLPAAPRTVPRVRGYDILFELAHGEQPFIDPAADPALAQDHPPVGLRTDSFDRLLERLAREGGRESSRGPRRTAPPLRVEEILAALPARGGDGTAATPTVSVTAVRSLRSTPGSLFVEVAGATPGPGGEPFDVMLMLDRSTGPFATDSWQWICRGLDRVIRQMRADDRLSIIVCGDRARLVSLRSDREAVAALLPELLREPPCRAADFDAAFRLAATVGRREGTPRRIVAVAHADSIERCRQEGRAALAAWHADVAASPSLPTGRPVSFLLVDPEAPPGAAGEPGVSAAARGGRVAADPVEIGRALLSRVFDQNTLVGSGCRLDVAFDPTRVAAYRLVGHRQTVGEIVADRASPPVDLHAGEVVRAVYEVVVRSPKDPAAGRPRGPGGMVAATLSCTLAGGGEHRSQASLEAYGPDRPPAGVSRGAALDDVLPEAHDLEILLAVALGESAGESAHGEPWRRSAAKLATLVGRWRARGDVTAVGESLIAGLVDAGSLPRSAGR